ncbi:5-dehydro-4-deoxy-D-glucuronate isomerase [Bacillus sp. CMF21]|uniref:5-dehydro-4-deoxy-D-glucuronate isomerase n=1 Tax=Metabacillus dongyingensis TaxID=2874282 RepID=UPI001CC1B257|nr:5-dehydro-4-deoxy-D-glucuronate isomerase [Metabacillus dongyingensis]UAL52226.1 5-dehydro-4-deoxy-D-glucuronate isomerase [Metabacillus dongyingensis]USK28544.1 5-dehydro-4-deoxy-D-glucuronate isomerase [Bacillus sp. CMF21]
MEIRYSTHPEHAKTFTTEQIREHYLIEALFEAGEIKLVYSMEDRAIVGGISPLEDVIALKGYDEIKADYFLERREVGIFNVGGSGKIKVDGDTYEMKTKDCLYVGMGKKELLFESDSAANPAKFYLFSAPAHKEYPTQQVAFNDIEGDRMGSNVNANDRVIKRMIHEEGIQSCQIAMGMTKLHAGSVWNSMPTHTHNRRMEVYLYFDLDEQDRMFHMMGEPDQTRHIVMKNEEAVISPPWSIHCGVATGSYTFIWAMAGENKTYRDMDAVSMNELR